MTAAVRRRGLLALLGAVLAGRTHGQARGEPLPRRNLLIELRETDEAQQEADGARAAGGVVVGTAGAAAVGGVSVETRRRSSGLAVAQRLRVLNGAEAEAHVGRREPLQWLEWAWTPNGPALVGGTEWIEIGRGVRLRPRWPGGAAPVTVTVRSDVAAPLGAGLSSRFDPDGQPRVEPGGLDRAGVLTTVTVPLGEWITIASAGGEASPRRGAGAVSSRDAAGERRVRLELRVTVAD